MFYLVNYNGYTASWKKLVYASEIVNIIFGFCWNSTWMLQHIIYPIFKKGKLYLKRTAHCTFRVTQCSTQTFHRLSPDYPTTNQNVSFMAWFILQISWHVVPRCKKERFKDYGPSNIIIITMCEISTKTEYMELP